MSDIFNQGDEGSRRQFVAGISKSLLGVGLAPLVGARLTSAADKKPLPPAMATNAKSVIYLYMNGGMSHIDSFDLKPDAPDVQGATKPIQTNVDGIQMGHFFPNVAKHMDKSVIINSMSTTSGAHRQSQYMNHSSYAMRGDDNPPYIGELGGFARWSHQSKSARFGSGWGGEQSRPQRVSIGALLSVADSKPGGGIER